MRRELQSSDDRELLRSSRERGDGFDVFYLRHREAILGYHARRVREPELAADLMAETFAAALLAVHDQSRDLPEEPLAWLFAIAHRKLIDSHRRGRVRDEARRHLALEPLALYDEDIERILEVAEDPGVLERLAATLPPEQLRALQARVLDEREYTDIAAELNCSEAVVRMRVSRALKDLRTVMEARDD